jgi:hypothetical protein
MTTLLDAPSTIENPDSEPIDSERRTGRRRGRRRAHAEHWTKATVVLLDRHIAFIDRLVADVRASTGAAIGRAHVIRSLVDALAASDLDLTSCRSESEMTSVLARRLRLTQPHIDDKH